MQDTLSKIKHRAYAKSSSFLMALLFTILCGAVALCLGYFINYFAKGQVVESTHTILDSEFRYVQAIGAPPYIGIQENRLYIELDSNGQLPDNFPQPEEILAEGLLVFSIKSHDETKRFAAHIHTLENGKKLLIGTDITQLSHDFQFMQYVGIASIIFVMLVVFVSYLISIFVVKGTNRIAKTAHEIIETGDLSRRVDMASQWDDLGNVANVLNLLLDRIEELMIGVRRVSDNIAHDLRTPLTRMRSHIEDLEKQNPTNTSYNGLIAEADNILTTFNALLRISRIETEQKRSQFKDLELNKVLDDIKEFYEPLAEENSIHINSNYRSMPYYGDKDLLFQAFANIVDNAIKFTPPKGNITISAEANENDTVISIHNTGQTIEESEINKIFQRFYRVEKSRNTPGTGLGLSLVSAIVQLHGGSIKAENKDGGFQIITKL